MLPPRMMQALGLMMIVAGVLAGFLTPMATPALVVGVGLGLGVLAATFVGGGPRPVPKEGFAYEDAMALLRRASVGGTLVGAAAVAVTAALWWEGRAGPVDVVQVFLLSLLVAYASTLTAGGLILARNAVDR